MSNLHPYLTWLRKKLFELNEICDTVAREPTLVHEAHLDAAKIAEEAGERAAKLGLPELHAKSMALIGLADPNQAKTFLAECIKACETPKTEDDLLTVAVTADRLGISARTVYRLCEEGKLPHFHVGSGRGTIRIRPSDLVAFERKTVEMAKPKNRITLEQLRTT